MTVPPGNASGGGRVSTPVAEGDLVAGKYRIEKVLGSGGMGVVVAATHIHLEQRVAIKFQRSHAADDEAALARFAREARALAKIESEHVARVIDVGALETGEPFMVLECLVGENLARIMGARGALGVSEVVTYILEACEAIAEAHALGIVHRDLKPENLFLANRAGGSRTIKVIDFGISKMSSEDPARDRGAFPEGADTSATLGSPRYMSPEQFRRGEIGPRSDIWSLGVTLYELLAQQPPFPGTTLPELFSSVLGHTPVPLRELRPEVPPELAAVVMSCLEKDPARRPADVAELARALSPFGGADAERSSERVTRVLFRTVWPKNAGRASLIEPPPPPETSRRRTPRAADHEARAAAVRRRADSSGTLDQASSTLASGPMPEVPAQRPSIRRRAALALLCVAVLVGGAKATSTPDAPRGEVAAAGSTTAAPGRADPAGEEPRSLEAATTASAQPLDSPAISEPSMAEPAASGSASPPTRPASGGSAARPSRQAPRPLRPRSLRPPATRQ